MGSPARRAAWRLGALVGLLIGEGLFLGLSFDAESAGLLPAGWWRTVLGAMPLAPQIGLAIAAAGLLIAGPRLREALAAERAVLATFRNGPFVAAQLLAFVGVVIVTASLFGVVLPRTHHPEWLMPLWLALSAAALLFWVAALVPPRVLGALVRHGGGYLAAGVVVGTLAWAAGRYTQEWWKPLRHGTLSCAAAVVRRVEPSAYVDYPAYLIGARRFAVEVSAECSGYEGIGLVWVFLGTYFWVFRRQLRFPRVLLVLVAATAAVWLANTLRIAALVIIGARISPEIAAGGFHSFSGILLFSGVALAAAAVAYRTPWFSRAAVSHAEHASAVGESPAPWIVPLMVMVATGLVTGLMYPSGLDPFYPLRLVTTGAAIWYFRREYRRLGWGFSAWPVLLGAGVFVAWIGLMSRGLDVALPFPGSTWARANWLVWRVAGFVLVVPLVDELAFRGYLARRIMAADFAAVPVRELSWPAIVVSALLFGALHAHLVAGGLAGVAYGWAARRRGRLADAVIAHAATNALLVGCAIATRSWGLLG